MCSRGARPRIAEARAAARPRARLLRRLARLLPHRPVTRRPGRGRAVARALPQPRAERGPGHRSRLPARHPREAHRRRHRALRARARGTRRVVRDVPQPRRDPGRRQGARPAVRRARAARPRHRGLERQARCRGARAPPGRAAEAALAALARVRRALPRDRRPAAPHLPASRRDGDLVAAADRARSRAARGHGRAADVPVGQGLLLRRGVPEDRPARARDALGGRGLRRADRAPVRGTDRPVPDPARRSGGLRRHPERGHRRRVPDREPRADAEPAAHAAGDDRRPDGAGGARAARADPGQGRPPVHRPPRAPAPGPRLRAAGRPSAARRLPAVDARGRRLPGPGAGGRDRARRVQRRGGRGATARDEPQAQPRRAGGVPRPLRRGRAGQGRARGDGEPRLRQARRLLRLRLPEVARSRVRAARIPVDLAASPLSGRVPLRAPQRPADGLLPAGDARPRRRSAAASRRGRPT